MSTSCLEIRSPILTGSQTGLQVTMRSILDTARIMAICRVRSITTWLSWVPDLQWALGLNLRLLEASRFIQAFGVIGRWAMKRQQAQNYTSPSLSMQAAVDMLIGES